MTRIDITDIERQARQMRAEEMRRLSGIFSDRLGVFFRLLGGVVVTLARLVGEGLRHLFSWNPQRLRHH